MTKQLYIAVSEHSAEATHLHACYYSKVKFTNLWLNSHSTEELYTCEVSDKSFDTLSIEGSAIYARKASKVFFTVDNERRMCMWDKLYTSEGEVSIKSASFVKIDRKVFGEGKVRALPVVKEKSIPFEESYTPSEEVKYRQYWAKKWHGSSRVVSQWNCHPWETDAESANYQEKIQARTMRAQLLGVLGEKYNCEADVLRAKVSYNSATTRTEAGKAYVKELDLSARRLEKKSLTQKYQELKALEEAKKDNSYFASKDPVSFGTSQKKHKDSDKGKIWHKAQCEVYTH